MKDQKFSGPLFEFRAYVTKEFVYGRRMFIDRVNSAHVNGFTIHIFRLSVAVTWHKSQ